MKDVVLVDAQAARVRRFREAVALYRESFVSLPALSQKVRAEVRAARKRTHARHAEAEEIRLHVFPNSAEALKFLRKELPYAWAPRPAVVFIDLYLDGEGAGFVALLKDDANLRDLPTVVLCSGAGPDEVRRAWEAGSNAVVDLRWEGADGLAKVRDVLRYWLTDAATPS